MDRIDGEILGILARNARISFSDLGREVGLSANAAAARVRRLELAGVIVGYTTVVAGEASTATGALEVFIDVRLDPATSFDDFDRRLAAFPEVADAVHMTGPYDALLHAFVSDTAALDVFLGRLKRECGASQTQTRVALRSGTRSSGTRSPIGESPSGMPPRSGPRLGARSRDR